MNETQKQYYDALSEVGRTEQAIEYEKDGAERDKKQYDNAIFTIEKIREQLSKDSKELKALNSEIKIIEENKSKVKVKIQQYEKDRINLEEKLNEKN